jgi:hypothetical protein
MAQRKTAAPDDGKTQRQRFIEAAREHGAAEDLDAFRRVVRAMATTKPMPKPKVGARKRKR